MMNQDNVPVKYLMNIWKTLPAYPTKFDALYEISVYLEKNAKSEFTELTLNGIWCDAKGVASWRGTKMEQAYNELVREGYVKKTKNTNGKDWFVIDESKNPFK